MAIKYKSERSEIRVANSSRKVDEFGFIDDFSKMNIPLLKGELKIDEFIFETVHSFCEGKVSLDFDSLLVDSLLGLFWSMSSWTTFWFILSPCIFSVSRLDWVSLWLMTSVTSSCKRLDLVSKLTLLTLKKKCNLGPKFGKLFNT